MLEELRLRTIQRNDEGVLWGRWQPSHVDNLLVEIMAPANEFIARFVYWNNHTFSIKVIKFATVLGELQVDGQYASKQTVLDQVGVYNGHTGREGKAKAAQTEGRGRDVSSGKLDDGDSSSL